MRKGSNNYLYALKAKESMLAAVEIFNSPLISFKTETTVTLACTAWTYLLQSHCLENHREIRKLDTSKSRRKFAKNDEGETLTVPLSELISLSNDVLDQAISSNLLFLIGIRNRVQHHVGSSIDQLVAPKIQANILAFRDTLTMVTHGQITIKNELPYALQFSELSIQQTKELLTGGKVSSSLKTFILEFEGGLSPEIRQSPRYQAKVKLQVLNKERDEDLQYVQVLGIGGDAPSGKTTTYLKEVEKTKRTATQVINLMKDEGFAGFGMQQHTNLWQSVDGKNPKYGYACQLAGRCFWYDKWINEVVRPFCETNFTKEEGDTNGAD